MKRICIALFAVSLALAYSCSKPEVIETGEVPTPGDEEFVEIRIGASLDNEITKTAYDDNGKMTWCDGDQARLIVKKQEAGYSYESQDYNTYTLETAYGDITNNGRHAEFYGMIPYHKDDTKDWLSTGFAVYPAGIVPINQGGNDYNYPYVKTPANVTGLASSIILVGTPDSNNLSEVTDFLFKTAMAVLKITVKNIPAEATALRLSTSDLTNYPLDGDFVLEKNSEGVVVFTPAQYREYGGYPTGYGYQEVDLSQEGVISSRDFYFNVPVTNYPVGTLSLSIESGSSVIMSKTINKELKLNRNECLSVPALLASHSTVDVDRNAVSPRLTYTNDDKSIIRVHITNSILSDENYNSDAWKDGNIFTQYSGTYDLYWLTDKNNTYYLNSTGTYYLNYLVLDYYDQSIPSTLNENNVLSYGSVPFYFIDKTSSKISLASCTVTASSTETTEGALENLWDGTTAYWHSVWDQGTHSYSEDYGVFIDIELPTGIALSKFQFLYQIRSGNNNGRPREVVYGYSNDGATWKKIGSVTTSDMDAAAETWVHLPYVELSSSVQYLRFGITKAGEGTSLTDGSGFTALSELELYGE